MEQLERTSKTSGGSPSPFEQLSGTADLHKIAVLSSLLICGHTGTRLHLTLDKDHHLLVRRIVNSLTQASSYYLQPARAAVITSSATLS
jgi:hypothetical protein